MTHEEKSNLIIKCDSTRFHTPVCEGTRHILNVDLHLSSRTFCSGFHHQVLALFNKSVRKLNSYLKAVVESDTEKELLAPRAQAQAKAKAAEQRRLTATSQASLGADLTDGGEEALAKLNGSNSSTPSAKKNKKGIASSSSSGAAAAAASTAMLLADPELAGYAVRGGDEAWEKALSNSSSASGAPGSVSLATSTSKGSKSGNYQEVSEAVSAAASSSNNGQESTVERVLKAAEDEVAAKAAAKAARRQSKGGGTGGTPSQKRPRILGGGFNENADRDSGGSGKKAKKKSKTPVKPDGKYKNQ